MKKMEGREVQKLSNPAHFIKAIDTENYDIKLSESLESLKNKLKTEDERWVIEFSRQSGFPKLYNIYKHFVGISLESKLDNLSNGILETSLLCIFILKRSTQAFEEISKNERAIDHISLSLYSKNEEIRLRTTSFLMSMLKSHHSIVLHSIKFVKKKFHENYRFEGICRTLKNENKVENQKITLQFLNSILQPEEGRKRIIFDLVNSKAEESLKSIETVLSKQQTRNFSAKRMKKAIQVNIRTLRNHLLQFEKIDVIESSSSSSSSEHEDWQLSEEESEEEEEGEDEEEDDDDAVVVSKIEKESESDDDEEEEEEDDDDDDDEEDIKKMKLEIEKERKEGEIRIKNLLEKESLRIKDFEEKQSQRIQQLISREQKKIQRMIQEKQQFQYLEGSRGDDGGGDSAGFGGMFLAGEEEKEEEEEDNKELKKKQEMLKITEEKEMNRIKQKVSFEKKKLKERLLKEKQEMEKKYNIQKNKIIKKLEEEEQRKKEEEEEEDIIPDLEGVSLKKEDDDDDDDPDDKLMKSMGDPMASYHPEEENIKLIVTRESTKTKFGAEKQEIKVSKNISNFELIKKTSIIFYNKIFHQDCFLQLPNLKVIDISSSSSTTIEKYTLNDYIKETGDDNIEISIYDPPKININYSPITPPESPFGSSTQQQPQLQPQQQKQTETQSQPLPMNMPYSQQQQRRPKGGGRSQGRKPPSVQQQKKPPPKKDNRNIYFRGSPTKKPIRKHLVTTKKTTGTSSTTGIGMSLFSSSPRKPPPKGKTTGTATATTTTRPVKKKEKQEKKKKSDEISSSTIVEVEEQMKITEIPKELGKAINRLRILRKKSYPKKKKKKKKKRRTVAIVESNKEQEKDDIFADLPRFSSRSKITKKKKKKEKEKETTEGVVPVKKRSKRRKRRGRGRRKKRISGRKVKSVVAGKKTVVEDSDLKSEKPSDLNITDFGLSRGVMRTPDDNKKRQTVETIDFGASDEGDEFGFDDGGDVDGDNDDDEYKKQQIIRMFLADSMKKQPIELEKKTEDLLSMIDEHVEKKELDMPMLSSSEDQQQQQQLLNCEKKIKEIFHCYEILDKLTISQIIKFLKNYNWRKDIALENFFLNSQNTLIGCEIYVDNKIPYILKKQEGQLFICEVCKSENNSGIEMVAMSECSHYSCRNCWRSYVSRELEFRGCSFIMEDFSCFKCNNKGDIVNNEKFIGYISSSDDDDDDIDGSNEVSLKKKYQMYVIQYFIKEEFPGLRWCVGCGYPNKRKDRVCKKCHSENIPPQSLPPPAVVSNLMDFENQYSPSSPQYSPSFPQYSSPQYSPQYNSQHYSVPSSQQQQQQQQQQQLSSPDIFQAYSSPKQESISESSGVGGVVSLPIDAYEEMTKKVEEQEKTIKSLKTFASRGIYKRKSLVSSSNDEVEDDDILEQLLLDIPDMVNKEIQAINNKKEKITKEEEEEEETEEEEEEEKDEILRLFGDSVLNKSSRNNKFLDLHYKLQLESSGVDELEFRGSRDYPYHLAAGRPGSISIFSPWEGKNIQKIAFYPSPDWEKSSDNNDNERVVLTPSSLNSRSSLSIFNKEFLICWDDMGFSLINSNWRGMKEQYSINTRYLNSILGTGYSGVDCLRLMTKYSAGFGSEEDDFMGNLFCTVHDNHILVWDELLFVIDKPRLIDDSDPTPLVTKFLNAHSSEIRDVLFLENEMSPLIISGGEEVKIWNLDSEKLQHTMKNCNIRFLEGNKFNSMNNEVLCGSGLENKVMILDLRSNRVAKEFRVPSPPSCIHMFSSNEILVGTFDGQVFAHDQKKLGYHLWEKKLHQGMIHQIIDIPRRNFDEVQRHRYFGTCSEDSYIRISDFDQRGLMSQVMKSEGPVESICLVEKRRKKFQISQFPLGRGKMKEERIEFLRKVKTECKDIRQSIRQVMMDANRWIEKTKELIFESSRILGETSVLIEKSGKIWVEKLYRTEQQFSDLILNDILSKNEFEQMVEYSEEMEKLKSGVRSELLILEKKLMSSTSDVVTSPSTSSSSSSSSQNKSIWKRDLLEVAKKNIQKSFGQKIEIGTPTTPSLPPSEKKKKMKKKKKVNSKGSQGQNSKKNDESGFVIL